MAKQKSDINSRMFYALRVSEESRVPVLFISAPGMGKSTTVEMFAEIQGYQLQMLRGNSTSPEEVMGYDTVQPGCPTAVHLRPTWYQELLDNSASGKKTLLFLDELTTCPAHVQAALLHLVLERRVGMEKIPDDTLIVSAGNYSQSLGSTFDLLAPLMNRFCIYNIIPEPSDIEMFLSKFSGAALGKTKDLIQVKKKELSEMNQTKPNLTEDVSGQIAEYIEQGVLCVTDMLQKSGAKPVDFKVTDLQGIYSDTDNDSALHGFITPRTLCFLRDATIGAYRAFGKEGISGKNYELLVNGLCGIGLSRNQKREVVSTPIGKEFVAQMALVSSEIDKMSNDKLPTYNKYFTDILSKSKVKNGVKFDYESLVSLNSKIDEIKKDPDLTGIERPIDPKFVKDISQGVLDYIEDICASVRSKGSMTGDLTEFLKKLPVEHLAKSVTHMNTCVDLLLQFKNITADTDMGYSDDSRQKLLDVVSRAKKRVYTFDLVIDSFRVNLPTEGKLIPQVNTLVEKP